MVLSLVVDIVSHTVANETVIRTLGPKPGILVGITLRDFKLRSFHVYLSSAVQMVIWTPLQYYTKV